MSGRTIVLILILSALTGILVFIAISPKKTSIITNEPSPVITARPSIIKEVAETTLSLTPNPLTLSSGSGTLNVNINTGSNKVTAVQMDIIYDPKVLTNVEIKEASFFPNPLLFPKKIDKAKGTIFFALGISPAGSPQMGTGTVATIKFDVLDKTQKQTTVSFAPTTLVTATGASKSVLKSTSNTTIVLSQ